MAFHFWFDLHDALDVLAAVEQKLVPGKLDWAECQKSFLLISK